MRRYLLVALWPAGLGAIAAATIIAARRAPLPAAAVADGPGSRADPEPAADPAPGADRIPREGDTARAPAAARARGTGHRWRGPATMPDWAPDLIRLCAISAADGVAAYAVMTLIGPPIIGHGQAIDEPIFRWTNDNQVRPWAAVLERLNKVGNTWTTWGAAGAAAACLGVAWRKQKWLPPSALGAAIVVDHYATLALRYRFNRLGPPSSPLGTYPAGGPDRVILFYGLIAHLLWREFSGNRRGKIWAVGSVTALAFHQAYCREYLSKHWCTDILSGLFYGGVLLAPFIAAIRLIAGPASAQADRDRLVRPGATQHGGEGLPQYLQVENE
jgi:hypothetical protein